MKLIVPLLKRYKCVTFPVLTMYTSVTPTSNIYYNASLLRNNNGSSQLDLFICLNYRGSSWKFVEVHFTNLFVVFAAPLRALFSLILRFCCILVLRSVCVNVLFSSVIVFFSFSALLFFHNFHRLLQRCALGIRMCTICITRFLIHVFLSQSTPNYNILVSQSHD